MKLGIIGLGDMGIGLASNILKAGLSLKGFDLRAERNQMLKDLGGELVATAREVAVGVDAVLLMVMTGAQIRSILFENKFLHSLKDGASIVITATIAPSEIEDVYREIQATGKNVFLIDSPVSGGKSGADHGTLTLMQAADSRALESCAPLFDAISKTRFTVGATPGMGQKTKAALQTIIGGSFTAIFEGLALGAKAGISAEVMLHVFSNSGVGSPLLENCTKLIIDRKFEGTGSQITTMHKDLGISLSLGKELGVPLFTAAAAYELFCAGKAKFPDEDNWCIVKVLEEISGAEVKSSK